MAPKALKPVASCELIDLKQRRVIELATLPQPVAEPTAHLLPDGRAIIVGQRRASIFDPTGDAWRRHITLRRSRRAHASVLRPDGSVLIMGGAGEKSMELVDPKQGTSRLLAARLPYALDDARAAPLADGRVWILGGQDGSSGDTTDRSWIVEVSGDDRTRVKPGPSQEIGGGIADHCLVRMAPWAVLVGGESQRNGRDAELAVARLLHEVSLTVSSLPRARFPHDDAVALEYNGEVIVFGGFATSTGPRSDVRLPLAVAAVERLALPADAIR